MGAIISLIYIAYVWVRLYVWWTCWFVVERASVLHVYARAIQQYLRMYRNVEDSTVNKCVLCALCWCVLMRGMLFLFLLENQKVVWLRKEIESQIVIFILSDRAVSRKRFALQVNRTKNHIELIYYTSSVW